MTDLDTDDLIVLLLGAQGRSARSRGRIDGITRLEKLVFLVEQEGGFEAIGTDSGFEAHNFGPFSAEIYKAVDVLAAAGLITDSRSTTPSREETWEAESVIGDGPHAPRSFALTERGERYFNALVSELPVAEMEGLSRFKRTFGELPLRQLIRYVYEKYPAFTDKSLIRDDILG